MLQQSSDAQQTAEHPQKRQVQQEPPVARASMSQANLSKEAQRAPPVQHQPVQDAAQKQAKKPQKAAKKAAAPSTPATAPAADVQQQPTKEEAKATEEVSGNPRLLFIAVIHLTMFHYSSTSSSSVNSLQRLKFKRLAISRR